MPGRKLDGQIAVDLHRPVSSFSPFPQPGSRAVFDHGAVRIETDDGELLEAREHPRELFFGRAGLRRNVRWDALDLTYFAGYAWWNYICAPFLFEEPGVVVEEIEPWRPAGAEPWRRLAVTFPPAIHTHSPKQVFYYDDDLRLRRHDYVADIVGRWAHAAHMCADHVEADGFVFPTRRWVRPIGLRNRALPGPTLVALRVSEIERRMTSREARPLAHPGLALQREGALGTRPQAGRPRAQGAAARVAHPDRDGPDAQRQSDVPGAAARRPRRRDRRLDARSSPRSKSATRTSRCIRTIPSFGRGRSSSRITSTRTSARRSGGSSGMT